MNSYQLQKLIFYKDRQFSQKVPITLSKEASKYSLLGLIMNSLETSTEGCSPCLLGAYIIFRIARRTEFLKILYK